MFNNLVEWFKDNFTPNWRPDVRPPKPVAKKAARNPVKPLQMDAETVEVLRAIEQEKKALRPANQPPYWHGQAMPTQEQMNYTKDNK